VFNIYFKVVDEDGDKIGEHEVYVDNKVVARTVRDALSAAERITDVLVTTNQPAEVEL